MGATTFSVSAKGKTAQEAFDKAVASAKRSYGHDGYTGSIAEKRSFAMITPPKGEDAIAYANKLMDDDDPRISDKWGPAGCIKLDPTTFLFFGWASD